MRKSNRKSKSIADKFFKRLDPKATVECLKTLLDTLPDVSFVIKDKDGRFMALNDRNASIAGFVSEDELIGKTSACYLPPNIAEEYERTMRQTIATGKPRLNYFSTAPDKSTVCTINSSAPLRDRKGNICGHAAIYRMLGDSQTKDYFSAFQAVATHINEHYAEPIKLKTLLEIANCSRSKFYRLFPRFFRMPVNEYILWTRINRARDLLEHTDLLLSEIASQTGFYDQAHFTRTFQRLRGVTPRQHRLQHQQKTDP